MTELGHGSNVSGLETVAAFDPKTREFVITSSSSALQSETSTPCPTAAKWWVGALGKVANMAVVFA